MQLCPNCGTSVVDKNHNCSNCNWSMEMIICTNCGSSLHMESDFCDSCGHYQAREFKIITNVDLKVDEMINDRYLVLDSMSNIVKDTLPNYQRFSSGLISDKDKLDIYRKISKHDSFPEIYDSFVFDDNDYIAITLNRDEYGQELVNLTEVWGDITDRDKLQIFRDWSNVYHFLSGKEILASVFDLENIFLDKDLNLKFETIITNSNQDVSLVSLGDLWNKLAFKNNSPEKNYEKYKIGNIISSLKNEEITSSNDLNNRLDELLREPLVKINHSAISNVGKKRANNEDNFYATTIKLDEVGMNRLYKGYRGLYIVCDGMGGHDGGEVASSIAVSSIRSTILPVLPFSLNFDDLSKLLEDSIVNQANERVFQINESQKRKAEKRMGTTVVVSVVLDNKVYVAHVGDSRVYIIKKERLEQVTEDHNVAMKNYRDGVGTYEDAIENSKTFWGKVLTQALGPKNHEYITPEINSVNISQDCYLLLCTDGLTDMVNDEVIEKIVHENWDDTDKAANELINKALENGGRDNITLTLSKFVMGELVFPPNDYDDIFFSNENDLDNSPIEMIDTEIQSVSEITSDDNSDNDYEEIDS